MSYGLTPEGFKKKTIEVIKGELEEEYRAEIDATLDLSPEEPMGQVVGINAQREAVVWELIETLANMVNPNASEGAQLDNTCALTGTLRESAKKSRVFVTLNVNAGFTKPAGTIMLNVDGNEDARFVNKSDVGPLTAGAHTGIEFESVDYGPVVANAGTLTVITNAISGLNTATNPLDAELGSLREEDTDLRVRREDEIAAPGACTPPATRADVLQVAGVKQVFVFENVTLETDENGLPGKSSEVVVFDGLTPEADDEEIATAVYESKPSGGETYGSIETEIEYTHEDGTRENVFVKWSRATVKQVYLNFENVEIDAEVFPDDGIQMIKDEVAAFAEKNQNLSIDVIAVKMKAAALLVPGVIDVPTLKLGFAASPSGTANLPITGREIADIDTSRIAVTTIEGTP